jgi:hypothetical protein
MTEYIFPLKIWGLALGLMALNYLMITSYFGTIPTQPIERKTWDFRIAELRQIETNPSTAVAGVSISRVSNDTMASTIEPTKTQTDSLHPFHPYFDNASTESSSSETFPQLSF